MKKHRCLKCTTYIYLPTKEELKTKKPKEIIYWLKNPRPGRIEILDEFNKRTGEKMKAFSHLGKMNEFIEQAYKKRIQNLLKK